MIKLVIPIFLVGILSVCSITLLKQRPEPEKVKQVDALVEQIPVHPSFRELGRRQIANSNTIQITKTFSSDAEYEVVKKYYLDLLLPQQWKLVEDRALSYWGVDSGARQLSFIKGEFFFSIQFEGSQSEKFGRNYAFAYAWDSFEFRSRVRGLPYN